MACNNKNASLDYLAKNKPLFDSYEAFLDYCFDKDEFE